MVIFTFLVTSYFFVGHLLSQPNDLPSFNGYRRDIQKIFADEVSSKKNIALVSQTARLLAIMEFMEPSGYSGFFDCLKKYPSWEDLNATKREQVADACGRVAISASIKSVGPAPASLSTQNISSTAISSVDVKLSEILNKLKEIDQRVSILQEQQKTIQENLNMSRDRTTSRRPAANETQHLEEDVVE